ncbi:hypothetical protein BDV93DRAFT_518467 [Ceratobasidium sp. AG-I]|nr:hypothetical protein BDV93DRAFT_518467 [Ceratobasidium sp. AG-I]
MEDNEDTPVYYVNGFEDDWSDTHSIKTITSGVSDNTMSTLTSEEASEYFQQIHGRAFPLAQTHLFLPMDDAEVQRLDSQHIALKLILNGNYYGPVKEVLSETGDRRKRALDLFTAEGNWVREMAVEFPHVDFTSVDTVPLVPHVQFPNILGYEVYDLLNGIEEVDESFDLVHVKRMAPMIWDIAAFVLEVYRILRPGGLLIWTEFESPLRDASVADHNIAEKSPSIGKAWQLVTDACAREGASINVWRDIPLLLDPENEIWCNVEGMDNRARGFTPMRNVVKMLPLTPWHPSSRLHDAGMIMQQITSQTWTSFIPALINEDLSRSEAEELVLEMCTETHEVGTRQLYANFHMFYAFKPARKPETECGKGTKSVNAVVEM